MPQIESWPFVARKRFQARSKSRWAMWSKRKEIYCILHPLSHWCQSTLTRRLAARRCHGIRLAKDVFAWVNSLV